ncbi:hypothetical protein M501DRAFT_992596 [Patellaria atrata CBS 101060]|uniref:Uncharacterized protein n=1 Tax=Patellaria atrata CBS 101060 TaxID=1346257 RepID=A0A9P4VSK1_9PEZI|nr:hypothetical protein M501DRAFT_992596 [Patellaria atrata CBS 101060]
MLFKNLQTIITFATLISIPAALADFRIYLGGDNSISEGGSVAFNGAWLLNAEPSCDDIYNSVMLINGYNDVTESDDWACDGCDANESIGNLPITRFEIGDKTNDRQTTSGGLGYITLYPKPDGTYDLTYSAEADGPNGSRGYCNRENAKAHEFTCVQPVGSLNGKHIITCVTDLVSVVSGN